MSPPEKITIELTRSDALVLFEYFRRIDLNRWLSEEIGMPFRETAEEDQPPGTRDRDSN